MVWATLVAQAIPAILGSGGGGGSTDVSQSSSNTSNVNLSSFLSNQSPEAAGGSASGNASASAQSASGSAPPLLPSPLATPYTGFGTTGAEDTFNAENQTGEFPKTLLYAGGALIAGLGLLSLVNKKKRR